MSRLTRKFVVLAFFIALVHGQGDGFSNPGTSDAVPSWQIGTIQDVEWSTTYTGDTYLGVFPESGEGFGLGGNHLLFNKRPASQDFADLF